jgi:hypothetical protein
MQIFYPLNCRYPSNMNLIVILRIVERNLPMQRAQVLYKICFIFLCLPSKYQLCKQLINKNKIKQTKVCLGVWSILYLMVNSSFVLETYVNSATNSTAYQYTLPQKKALITLFFGFNSTFKCYRIQCYCKSMAIIAFLKVLLYVLLLIALIYLKRYISYACSSTN